MALDFSELNGFTPDDVGCGRDKCSSPTTQPASKMKTLLTLPAVPGGQADLALIQIFPANVSVALT
jgi:hypothetical protein